MTYVWQSVSGAIGVVVFTIRLKIDIACKGTELPGATSSGCGIDSPDGNRLENAGSGSITRTGPLPGNLFLTT